jgi:glycosyltransferase involved in cell wall biosynthesis
LHPQAGIVYLDPDILVVEPLAQVEAAFAHGALALLTPHLLEPIDDDNKPGEREILVSGTYNCGFVAINAHAEADRLIAWWADRLEFGAVSDIAAGLFTDQKWIDLVPGLFPDVHVLRDAGYNLAYWNLSQRPMSRRDQRWHAAERPLVFVHFSGVDLDRPAQFSKHQNRHTQATIGELQHLYADYLGRLAANGHGEHRGKPYAFGRFADGEPICSPVRAVYRRYFDKGATQAQAHPFSMDRSLYDLPCDELPAYADAPVTRLMYATWKMRADLWRAFDIGETQGRTGFIRWFASNAGREMRVPDRHLEAARRALASDVGGDANRGVRSPAQPVPGLLRRAGSASLDLINWSCRFRFALDFYAAIPQATRHRIRRRLERIAFAAKPVAVASMPKAENPAGINLVGYAHGEFGVAEILRRHAHTLESGGVPFVVRNFDVGVASRQSDRSMQGLLSEECRYDVNLFCINADQMPVAREHLGDAVFAGRYNIGCWFWELEKFPAQWHGSIDLVDEIWVSSPFVRDAIAACTAKPVHVVPVALDMNLPANHSRGEFGLAEDDFLCLYSFDFNSFATRKNAQGVIASFRRAFADGRRNVRLLIKTTNGERFPETLQRMKDEIEDDDRIEVRDGFLDRGGMWALQACCDCYVSLHRSEGLGLGMAECMLLGKPVVATAYSGNLAFMDAQNSCLVDCSLIPVEEGEYPAWQGQHWAEPDVDQAAAYLQRLADDPAYARQIGKRAKSSVSRNLSACASLAAMTARLADIRARRLP